MKLIDLIMKKQYVYISKEKCLFLNDYFINAIFFLVCKQDLTIWTQNQLINQELSHVYTENPTNLTKREPSLNLCINHSVHCKYIIPLAIA